MNDDQASRIGQAPVSTAYFVPLSQPDGRGSELSWLIRMESARIDRYRQIPFGDTPCALRIGSHVVKVDGNDVAALLMMIGISQDASFNEETLYEDVCNKYSEYFGSVRVLLPEQFTIQIHLYGDSEKREHTLCMPHFSIYRDFEVQALADVSAIKRAWSPNEFKLCVEDFRRECPTKLERWRRLGVRL